MNTSYKDILLAILTITDYPNNKEEFVAKFEQLNLEDALFNTIKKLPQETQETIKACKGDMQQIERYIPLEIYKEELISVNKDALVEFVMSLAPDLSEQQKEQIQELFPKQQFEQTILYTSLSHQA